MNGLGYKEADNNSYSASLGSELSKHYNILKLKTNTHQMSFILQIKIIWKENKNDFVHKCEADNLSNLL